MTSPLKSFAIRSATALPYVGHRLEAYLRLRSLPPPGHYYSPIPDVEDIRTREADIWRGETINGLPGIDLHECDQLQLVDHLAAFHPEQPFPEQRAADRRYYFDNRFFSYSDAIFYYCLLRHLKPRRVIEIGSGFSSAVLLDTNELFFHSAIHCTFIDPEPARLQSLLKPADHATVTLLPHRLQDIDRSCFRDLGAGDILFIDSSHVSRTGSEIHLIFFEILPLLSPGVFIHVHDVYYPFEYPREFVYRQWSWNEIYLLRAFLSYNREFQIRLFPSFLERFHRPRLGTALPLALKPYPVWPNLCGGSLWIERARNGADSVHNGF